MGGEAGAGFGPGLRGARWLEGGDLGPGGRGAVLLLLLEGTNSWALSPSLVIH